MVIMALLLFFVFIVLLFFAVAVYSFLPAVIIWILLNIFNITGTLTFWSIWLACGLFYSLIALLKD
jgi:hypothetical protein